MTQQKHTTTPWHVSRTYPEGQYRVTASNERVGDTAQLKPIATVYSPDDAAFAVLACNTFDELRDAADEALNTLIGCCIPAGGCDDRRAILDTQTRLRKVLQSVGVTYTDEASR